MSNGYKPEFGPGRNEYDLFGLPDEFQSSFYDELENILRKRISTFASHALISSDLEKKQMRIGLPEISCAYYALEFRQVDEISFRFDSSEPSDNYQWLEQAQTKLETWQAQLAFPIRAEKWGQKRARFGYFFNSHDKNYMFGIFDLEYGTLEEAISEQKDNNIFHVALKTSSKLLPGAPFWRIKALAYADIAAQLIRVTSLDLLTIFETSRPSYQPRSGSRIHKYEDKPYPNSHQLLEIKINEIQEFLAGRAVRGPKDEELCDWIQLCYLFDLPREGQQLFSFVQSQKLNNDWLYRRTKKYADLCRLKATNKG